MFIFEGIGKLTAEEITFRKDFPFTVFNCIRHLKLSGVRTDFNQVGLQINLDLDNLEELELHYCNFKEIIAWNSTKTLKNVMIRSCNNLSSIPPLDDILVVSITAPYGLTHFQSSGGHKKFTITGRSS
jgi:hypothetical protein